jgi:CubicO group peptidase (beta-lactamase class C family)
MSGLNRRDLLTLAAGMYAAPLAAKIGANPLRPDLQPLDEYVERYLRTMQAPGLTLGLAGAQGPIHVQAFGFTDVAAKTAVTAEHLFEIGSISKSFVGVMLLQLQEEGRLAFDHDVTRYLPWLPIETDFGPVQIHHLLTHSSGLPRDFPLNAHQAGVRFRQSFEPGTHFHYSNSGYAALGRLIEKVDQRPWSLALRKRILEPLGMTDTEPLIASVMYGRMAQSYVARHDDRFYHRGAPLAVARSSAVEAASGCIASTSLDMTRYMAMYINRGMGPTRRVLQEASFKALTTSHVPAGEFGPNAGYGYGVAVEQVNGHTIVRHTGGMVSFMSAMHIDIDAGFGAFASINAQQNYRPNAVARYAVSLLRARHEGKPAPQPPAADETALAATQEYEGSYVGEDGTQIEVTSANGALLLHIESRHLTLRHKEDEQFMADEQDFAFFPWVFDRAAAQTSAGERPEQVAAITDLSWGPHWYRRSGRIAASSEKPDSTLQAFCGFYYSENPWLGGVRVIQRRGRLWLDDGTPLEALGDSLFRAADAPESPETVEFLEFVDGQAQLLRADGEDLRRIPDLAWQTP